ncbi:alpha-tocopherol transfer protein-like [Culex pipiens pallens]|uniref:alpha-tocopherol transfer protein-like n=1 Tax=Culex pipiens pallens TaxID=42434 RepID=UPI0019530707|nr:alpha-tocopherol transfer protein-like [Culex pipiens pallens]
MDKNSAALIETIKTWLATQEHLPEITDHEIHTFLHSNYYDVEKTKSTIENYYTFRTSCKGTFSDLDVLSEELQSTMAVVEMIFPPQPTPEGYKLAIFRFATTDASKFNVYSATKFASLCLDQWLKEDGLIEGHIIIYDLAGCHLGQLARLRFFPVKNYFYFVQEALPIRMKEMHFANIPSIMDKILLFLKPFMKRELLDVMHLHTTNESLLKVIPANCLPNEYGGTAGPFKQFKDEFQAKLLANRDAILQAEMEQRVDERKRASRGYGLFNMFRK